MNEVFVDFINQGIKLHKEGKFDEAEAIYNRVLNRKHFEEDLLYLLADLYLRKEFNGLAINLLFNLLQNNPKHAAAWLNLGVGFRKENFYNEAKQAWRKAIEHGGETAEVCNNMAGLYADHAEPEKAIEWCDKAIKLSNSPDILWQKSLALLSMRDWAEGWALYESRQKLEAWSPRTEIDVPMWDFKVTDHLYIHGEQGVGDEIMFLSCIEEVFPLVNRLTIEVNEKVAHVVKKTWPNVNVITEPVKGDYTAKIPLGSLTCHFRKNGEFPGTAFLKPDPDRVKYYRKELNRLGKGPHIALAWFGGSKQTRVDERSISLNMLKPIMDEYTCVSGQYEHTNPMLSSEREKNKLPKLNDHCVGLDMAEQAAFFMACDAVVTVQQTAVLVAGAVGTPCYVLTPGRPSWVMGVKGDDLPWFKSVKLFRRTNEWEDVIERVKKELDANFRGVSILKQANA